METLKCPYCKTEDGISRNEVIKCRAELLPSTETGWTYAGESNINWDFQVRDEEMPEFYCSNCDMDFDKPMEGRLLYKTTIVIWSEFNPEKYEIDTLAREAMSGNAYCSKQESVKKLAENDPDWDGTEFFGDKEEYEEKLATEVEEVVDSSKTEEEVEDA